MCKLDFNLEQKVLFSPQFSLVSPATKKLHGHATIRIGRMPNEKLGNLVSQAASHNSESETDSHTRYSVR